MSVGRDFQNTEIEAPLNPLATLLLMKPRIYFPFPAMRAHGSLYSTQGPPGLGIQSTQGPLSLGRGLGILVPSSAGLPQAPIRE